MPEALTEWTHWNERGLEKAWEHAKNYHDKRQTTVWVLFQSFLNIKKSFFWDVYLVSLCLQLMTGTIWPLHLWRTNLFSDSTSVFLSHARVNCPEQRKCQELLQGCCIASHCLLWLYREMLDTVAKSRVQTMAVSSVVLSLVWYI